MMLSFKLKYSLIYIYIYIVSSSNVLIVTTLAISLAYYNWLMNSMVFIFNELPAM